MNIRHQILFWITVTAILTIAFGIVKHDYIGAFYFVTFLLPVIIVTSIIYDYFLIPQFLLKKRYLKFVLYSVYTLIFSLYLEMVVIYLAFILFAHYRFDQMPVETSNILFLTLNLYFFVVVKILIKLLSRYFSNQDYLKKLEIEKQQRNRQYFVVRSDRENKRIFYREVSYIESLGDYVQIILSNGKKIITREKISRLHARLPEDFVRIHRSFLVNRNHVRSYTQEQVTLEQAKLPVGRSYKKGLESLHPS